MNTSTTNHLEKLDPALSRPGRMDVWIEFKNASRWQAEQLFKNFFPSADPTLEMSLPTDEAALDAELGDIKLNARREAAPETPTKEGEMPMPPTPSVAEARPARRASSSSVSSMPSTATKVDTEADPHATQSDDDEPELSPEEKAKRDQEEKERIAKLEQEHAIRHVAAPLTNTELAALARKFANSLPDEEFSVAALQGCELRF
jgi:mitochondrial chaperone BCS1